jgi:SAM-dependent methyltransferase
MSSPRWLGSGVRLALLDNLRPQPDRETALARYARLAQHYEDTTTRIRDVRQRAIDLLELRPGETVFDVACGAGATLGILARHVGPRGRAVGIEQSLEMAALARDAATGSAQVTVLHDPVESFQSAHRADAVLFCYTHDVLQSPTALANLFEQVRPGARVAVAGLCLAPWWGAPANAWVLWGARNYLTTWHGLRRPWAPLLAWCPDLRVVGRHHLGTGYLAVGRASGR